MNLSTRYLGFTLPHPIMAGASPLADSLDSARRVEDAGAAAIVMRSLFEEQLSVEAFATHAATAPHADSFGEAATYWPDPPDFVLGPDAYLHQVRQLKDTLDIPVIASLNGSTAGGWLSYARQIEQAGADALELNVYYVPTDAMEDGDTLEQRVVDMITAVKQTISIPLAVKLSPFYTSLAHFARRLDAAGADGLVLFNRFFEPDVDLDELQLVAKMNLSLSSELPLRLRWLGLLCGRVRADLAVTGGVHTTADALKAVTCGASAVQMVSALLRHGPEYIQRVRKGMSDWLEEHEYFSLAQAQGSMSALRCPDPAALGRANYMHMLQTWQPDRV